MKLQDHDSITVSAFMYGNSLSRANDVRHDIRGGTDKKEDIAARRNAVLIPVAIGRWPFLFMAAIKGIGPCKSFRSRLRHMATLYLCCLETTQQQLLGFSLLYVGFRQSGRCCSGSIICKWQFVLGASDIGGML